MPTKKQNRKIRVEKIAKNKADRSFVSHNIKEELLQALDTKIIGFRNIAWIVKSKKYNTIKDIKYNLIHIILNAYNGHIKRHKADDKFVSLHSVDNRRKLGAEADRLIDLVFDKKHPSANYNLVEDRVTLKYKLKEEIIKICDDVYLGEYKLHARIGREGEKIVTIPDYVVRAIDNGGLRYTNNSQRYYFDNVIQLNEDNLLIMIKMYADLYRKRMKKKVDTEHWVKVLDSVNKKETEYTLQQIESRRQKAIELLNKASVDILGEGRILQVYTEKESGRLFADEWLNMQNLPSEMRFIAMGGLGYYEYDIENAHYNFLYQLNNMFNGHHLESISYYIRNTKKLRTEVAEQTGIEYGVIKDIMISLIYGAGLNSYHRYNKTTKTSEDNAIMGILKDYTSQNKDDAVKLFDLVANNSTIKGLKRDINTAQKHMKTYWKIVKKDNKEYLVNTFGKIKATVDEDGNKVPMNKLMSHMLMGIEASLLVFVMEEEQKDFVMPQHDGWVSLVDWKTKTLERIIKAKSTKMMMEYANIGKGIDVSIKKKKMNDIEKGDWAEKILRAKTIKDLTYSN